MAAFLLWPTLLQAKTLYVDSSSGNDATSYASNGPSSPWLTLGRATWGSTNRDTPNTAQAAQAGDTVIVRAGTYNSIGANSRLDPWFNPVNSGTAGAPLIFRAEPGVTIQPIYSHTGTARSATAGTIQLATAASSVNDAYAGFYIRITAGTGAGQSRCIMLHQDVGGGGIKAGSYDGATRTAQLQSDWTVIPDATSQYAITTPGPLVGTQGRNYVTWDGFRIVEGDSYSPDTGPVVIWSSDHVMFINNRVEGTSIPLHADNHNSVRLNNSTNITLRNNTLIIPRSNYVAGYNNPQNEAAIMMYYTDQALVENNDISAYVGIFPKGGTGSNGNHIIRYNRFHDCARAFRTSFHVNVDFTQNLVENCTEDAFQPAENISGIRFYNNTVVNTLDGIYNWYTPSGFEVFNNIFSNVAHPVNWEGGMPAGTYPSDHNDYHAYTNFIIGSTRGPLSTWQTLGYDTTGSLEVNPLFVNAASGDYRLQAGSPVRTAGRGGVAMGMYLTGTEIIGLLNGNPPPPPPTSRCDVNGDTLTNVNDVQLCSNQAISITACASGDINQDGVCNVVDVQRTVNAALGGTCVTQ